MKLEDAFLSQEAILDAVDEYTLYCYYTGIPDICPGVSHKSPLHTDDHPSFVFFETKHYNDVQYLWKDMALGESGSIFKLVKLLYGLSNNAEVYDQIAKDFGLREGTGRERIQLYTPKAHSPVKIEIAPIPFDSTGHRYWAQYGITTDILEQYYTQQITCFWVDGRPRNIWNPTFAYQVGEYYQIYSPYAPKASKFRNDFPDNYFFGYLQLPPKGDVLIIDKSAKDVMFCKSIGLPAVTGKSETTWIPHYKMNEFKERFTNIYLMLDNDRAGKIQTDKYLQVYPWLQPRFLDGAKDKTDLCLQIGREQAREHIYTKLGI